MTTVKNIAEVKKRPFLGMNKIEKSNESFACIKAPVM